MKKQIILTAFIAFAFTTFNACKNEPKAAEKGANTEGSKTAEQHAGDHIFACPMHPEVTGKESDKCPKCGMALVHNDNAGGDGKAYEMRFVANPAVVESGKAATLSFIPGIKGDNATAVALDVQHGKKLHLIVVSKDLTYFDHIHPEYQADGSYQIKVLDKATPFKNGRGHNETKFDNGGDFVLFADYKPTGANHQLERIELNSKGAPSTLKAATADRLVANVDGYTVTLKNTDGFKTNNAMHITAVVTQGGKIVSPETFENYLEAKAHVVGISADTKKYLHIHPDVDKGGFDLHTTFEQAGLYRMWLQFQTGGKVHAADFVVNVAEAKAGEVKGHDVGQMYECPMKDSPASAKAGKCPKCGMALVAVTSEK